MMSLARIGSLVAILACAASAQQLQWSQSPINGHWYAATVQLNWPDAELYAQSCGGHLATIRSAADNSWIRFAFSGSFWIGMNRANEISPWLWSSSEPITYTSWGSGQPSGDQWCCYAQGCRYRNHVGMSATNSDWVNYTVLGCDMRPGLIEVASDDCDANGVPDTSELLLNAALDLDSNGILDVCQQWFVDADMDGHGAQPPVCSGGPACGPGLVLIGDDCDDANPLVYPGAVELCNGLDDDCNGLTDDGLVFVTYYLDGDGDGFGQAGTELSACLSPTGYVTNSSDCDDTRAFVCPGAPELCNGIDDSCDGVIDEGFMNTYCTAGTTVHGCVPSIAGIGTPHSSATASFNIVVSGVPALQYGTIFYGFYPVAIPWGPGSPSYRCVSLPIQRTQILNSGGVPITCNGVIQMDFNAWISANPSALGMPASAGQVFYAQGWFRDNGAPKGSNMSDALRFTMCD